MYIHFWVMTLYFGGLVCQCSVEIKSSHLQDRLTYNRYSSHIYSTESLGCEELVCLEIHAVQWELTFRSKVFYGPLDIFLRDVCLTGNNGSVFERIGIQKLETKRKAEVFSLLGYDAVEMNIYQDGGSNFLQHIDTDLPESMDSHLRQRNLHSHHHDNLKSRKIKCSSNFCRTLANHPIITPRHPNV
jgi:hypothetical protein